MDTALSPLLSVNWHITDLCNFACRYCFATFSRMTAAPAISLEDGLRMIRKLREAGTDKITFVGGEPLLHPFVVSWCAEAKRLGMTTMLVTNGSGIVRDPSHPILEQLSWCGLSIDSSNGETQRKIGRRIEDPVRYARQFAAAVRAAGVRLKINSVITKMNVEEDMSELVAELHPDRWKLFQYLPIEGERIDPALLITRDEFLGYMQRHRDALPQLNIAWEDNARMTGSYAMIDPLGRFFDTRMNPEGKFVRAYSRPILSGEICEIFSTMNFASEKLAARDGIYAWRAA